MRDSATLPVPTDCPRRTEKGQLEPALVLVTAKLHDERRSIKSPFKGPHNVLPHNGPNVVLCEPTL